MSLKESRSGLLIALGTISLLALVWRIAAGPHPVDDAYITFRYAANLLINGDLLYNSGEKVLGTSTPLGAILLAGIAFPFMPESIPVAALVLNSVSDAASVILIGAITLRLRLPTWVIVGSCLLFALAPASVRYSIGGMETSLATLAILSATYSFLGGRELIGANIAGLSYLIRPDAIAIAAANIWSVGMAERRVAWRTVTVTACWILLAALILQIEYGSPFPQSMVAKLSPIYQPDPFDNSRQILSFFGGAIPASPLGVGARGLVIDAPPGTIFATIAIFVTQAVIWAFGMRSLIQKKSLAWIIALYPLSVIAVYLVSGLRGGLMAEWYLVPLLPFWIIPLLVGIDRLLRRFTASSYSYLSWSLLGVFMILSIAGFDLGRQVQQAPTVPLATWEDRELLYIRVAEIHHSRFEGAVVAAPEIGALGFYCDCRILDTVGLVSPQSLEHYPLPPGVYSTNNAIPRSLVLQEKPDYIVSLDVFLRDTLLTDDEFLDSYVLIWESPIDAFGSNELAVFRRGTGSKPD